jgi:hypothetical protein
MVSLHHRKHCAPRQHSRWTQHLGDEVPPSAVLQATLVVLVDALCCLVGTLYLITVCLRFILVVRILYLLCVARWLGPCCLNV